jgi:glycosyltransferase involved in cell wall biosynthesis
VADAVKVCFVSSHSRAAGSERYLETLVGELGPEWTAGAICLEDGPLVERLRALDVAVQVIQTSGSKASFPQAALRLRRALTQARPDVVHANGVKAATICALGSVTPFVWVKHDYSWDGKLADLVARRARLVVGVSDAVTSGLRRRANVRVVHNGIPGGEPGGGPDPAAFGLPTTARVVVLAALLNPIKGQGELLEATPALVAALPDAHVVFVGADDPSAPGFGKELRRRGDELGVAQHVSFLGYRADAPRLLGSAHAVAVPTLRPGRPREGEGFGLVALEAMTSGTPVVGYESGALPEVVGDCGRLVAPGDRDALARALAEVLGDDDLRRRLRDCGLRRARETFSLTQWVDGMCAAYREAAS